MESLLLYLPFLIPIVVANLSERYRLARQEAGGRDPRASELVDLGLRYLPHGLLIAINLGLLGLAALAMLNEVVRLAMPEMVDEGALAIHWFGVAVACFFTSALAFLPLLPGVRRWLARWLPIDADSVVHMTALAFAVYQVGLSLGQMALIGDLETLTDAAVALTIWDVLLTGVPLALFALAGIGLFIRRGGRGTLARLGLYRPTWRHLLAAAAVTVLLLAFDQAVNVAWEWADPTGYELMSRVTENIFGGLATVAGALVLGLSAGVSEELLFRGAVQPRLGLGLTAFLFAIGHLQYGLTPATLEILIIGLVLGLMRNRTSTTVCILIHAGYNTIGTLMSML